MKIIVCVKIFQGELNPFDACALECALSTPDADITVLTMGPESALDEMKRLSRLDVNRLVMLCDSRFAGADTLATSYALSCFIKKENPDLVLCGRQSIDGDTAQVGPGLSQMLGYSLVTNVTEYAADKCKTRFGNEEVTLPCVMTIERINTLRFPSIRSKAKDVEILTSDDIGADIERCGLKGSPTRVMKTFESQRGMRKCKFIDKSELDATIKKSLVEAKESEEKQVLKSDVLLPSVWAIGETVAKRAAEIAENVTVITSESPLEIAELAKKEKPNVILWNADLWGRKNAPITAAILQTGLCADCTHLETDGENLFMYRPARGGNITAKIKCLTKPQMATVRCEEKSEDILFGIGKGAKECIDKIEQLAKKYGGETGASRTMVDSGLAPYEKQIGLTGKTVSPSVYVAIGISGAVQHTCAIENAKTVIAVNPDKDARIFDYADYGIICSVEEL
ncbi:MAG: FAD-binding protein [Clostridia bacterium]|nr:FAD-binding protein [Clostridia bacterium]